MSAFYRGLGKEIRLCREAESLTQPELGNQMTPARTRAYISNVELGKRQLKARELWQLCCLLNVPPRALLGAGQHLETLRPPFFIDNDLAEVELWEEESG